MNDAAAAVKELPSEESLAVLKEPGAVVIVGHTGRMGSMLLREGLEAGLGIEGIDVPFENLDVFKNARLVIPCVLEKYFESTLRTICPAMPADAILCDITSVKVAPIAQMLNLWPGPVVGSHPLFGPNHGDTGLLITMSPSVRSSADDLRLATDFFRALGYEPFESDADTHDKAMARIQNMNFITSLAYFAQTADDQTLKKFITPSFQKRLDAAHKLLTEDGELFIGLFEANPYSQAAVRQFSKLLSLASAGDLDLLLSRARHWWPEDMK